MTRVEQKFHVKENSQIKDIYSKLNSIQKKAIVLFDADRNGTMDAKEAKAFNSSIFSEQANGDLDVYLQLSSGKKQKTTVKQNEFDNTVLSLERVQNERIEQRNGKKVRVIQPSDELKKSQGQSISKKIHSQFECEGWKKISVDANGNARYECEIPCLNGDGEVESYVKDYKIFDKAGNVIESEEHYFVNGSEWGDILGGKIKQKGNKYYHYDEKDALVGMVEEQEDGKDKYMDAKGNVLYYKEAESEDLPQNSSRDPYSKITTHFYDKNKKLYAIVREKLYGSGSTTSKVEFYENGKIVSTKTGFDRDMYGSSEAVVGFLPLSEEHLGEYYH